MSNVEAVADWSLDPDSSAYLLTSAHSMFILGHPINAMNRFVSLILVLCCLAYGAGAQQIKAKEAKRLLQEGKLTGLTLLLPDQFKPGTQLMLNAKLLFSGDQYGLASDIKGFWEEAQLLVNDSALQITKDLLEDDGILFDPWAASKYYSEKKLIVVVKWKGVEASKQLTPDFCAEQLLIEEVGANGANGVGGYQLAGGRGMDGKNGEPGPDIEVQFEEATIGEKQHLVIVCNKKSYFFQLGCGSIIIRSKGGNGGGGGAGGQGNDGDNTQTYIASGGRGGQGGEGGYGGRGGNFKVHGSAIYLKYKQFIELESIGGKAGKAGRGGVGGQGYGYSQSGRRGQSGRNGGSGLIELID